jgi:type II secretory pathway component PulM
MGAFATPDRLLQWWSLRSRTEQRLLLWAGVGIAVLIVWLLAWDPMQRDTLRLERVVATQRVALDEARRQADAIAGLARSGTVAVASDTEVGVAAALTAQGLKLPASAIQRIDNQHWRVTIDSIAFNAVVTLLESLQRDTGLRAIEFSAVARVEAGQVRVELTLGR